MGCAVEVCVIYKERERRGATTRRKGVQRGRSRRRGNLEERGSIGRADRTEGRHPGRVSIN